MSKLLLTTAVVELGAGVAVAVLPSACVSLLLGSSLETPTGITLTRIIGAALFTLGMACLLACRDHLSRAAIGLVVAVLFYNVAISAALVAARIEFGLQGPALWPGAILHLSLAIWCVVCLRKKPEPDLADKTRLGENAAA